MCTVIVSIDPESAVPVLLAGVRDEFVARPWMGPDAYWPDHPGIVGGRDLQAGGTWLAVNPAIRRVAALLNAHGVPAPEDVRRSRGDLPLRAAAEGELAHLDLTVYDPFHLVVAGLDGVRLWSWNGERLTEEKLRRGTHVIVNSGLNDEEIPRVARFRPLFEAAPRPSRLELGSTRSFWGRWARLAAGDGLALDDPGALIFRHVLPDGRIFASLSVGLVALGEPRGMRYDFLPQPEDPATWYEVDVRRG
ncbi:NRDE family protein [Streptosporangiaceae bacterium NEAU-GS5]|nr:NRDE family protein [Streptosporangiaceae bacterium NEAU-GS5]